MAISESDITAVETAAVETAKAGVKSLTIGDRSLSKMTPKEILEAARALDNENEGGIFTTTFAPKGHY